jgi:hypothetical protein
MYMGLLLFKKDIEAAAMRRAPKPTKEKAYPWYGKSGAAVEVNACGAVVVEYRKALVANSAIAVRSIKISPLNFTTIPALTSNYSVFGYSLVRVGRRYFKLSQEYG